MTSPDLRQYNDLVLYDRDPAALVDRALLDAGTKLPGWVPREGNTEVALIEAMALEVAELVFAVNRLPGAVIEILMRLFGITKGLGAPAQATVTFSLSDSLGHEVPAGTQLRLVRGGTLPPVDFTTDAATVAAPGSAVTNPVGVTAAVNTEAVNGTASGTALQVLSSVSFVDSCVLASTVGGGADPETEDDWRNRGVQQFARLVSTLVLPDHFTAEALLWPGVFRAATIDNWDPTLSGGAGGTSTGHVTVAVYGEGGAPLSTGAKGDLEADLQSKAQVNLAVHVVDPTINTVNVTVTVHQLAGFTSTQVHDNVAAAIDTYLSSDTWPWAGTVRINELIALVDGAAGVDWVVSVTVPASDVALTGAAPLAEAGTVTVTVVGP
jgi:uncharacterized phage protein gp47/JayE